jgi:hypothetical protein
LTDTASGLVTASKNGGFTLNNTSLTSTDGMSLGLSNMTSANLTDTGSGHTFNVTGWTGGGAFKGMTETLVDSTSANLTLTNTSLVMTGLPTTSLSGFTTANLTDRAGGITFLVSGWTGSGSLTDSAAKPDTVTAVKTAGFTLNNTSLSSTDGTVLGLSGITTAILRDLGNSHTFIITGWTGAGGLTGTSETLVDSVAANVALTNGSLAVTGLPTVSLTGFSTSNLIDTSGGITFTVSGWTGSGSLADSAAAPDTVTAVKTAVNITLN